MASVYLNGAKAFAFVEFRTVAEASNALALDGVEWEGQAVRFRRPRDYDEALESRWGPTQPDPNMTLEAVGLTAARAAAGASGGTPASTGPGGGGGHHHTQWGENKVFIGGIPHHLGEKEVRELVDSFGRVKAFHLVVDAEAGGNKGFAFCEWESAEETDAAIAAADGLPLPGAKKLTVKRALSSSSSPAAAGAGPGSGGRGGAGGPLASRAHPASTGGGPSPALGAGASATPAQLVLPEPPASAGAEPVEARMVIFGDMVTLDEVGPLVSDEDYEDLVADVRDECVRVSGGSETSIVSVCIPRLPCRDAPQTPHDDPAPVGFGYVFVVCASADVAATVRRALDGRPFAGRNVTCLDVSGFKRENLPPSCA